MSNFIIDPDRDGNIIITRYYSNTINFDVYQRSDSDEFTFYKSGKIINGDTPVTYQDVVINKTRIQPNYQDIILRFCFAPTYIKYGR